VLQQERLGVVFLQLHAGAAADVLPITRNTAPFDLVWEATG
jgi:hypothetical protein